MIKPYGLVTCRAHREIHDQHLHRVRRPGLRRGCRAHRDLLLLVLLRGRRQWLQHQRRQ